MEKTLVIILSETRASELTFDNFKKNVLDELNADLCVCIGVNPEYDYTNPFYQLAKYKFTYNEPSDFGDAFDYAYDTTDKPKYEYFENINAMHGTLTNLKSTKNIIHYGANLNIDDLNDDEVVVHNNDFPNELWKNQVFGIKRSENIFVKEMNVTTYKKPLFWREFLKIKDQFLGGIKGPEQHPGSAGILIFFRWFLLKNLIDHDLIDKYDRFIITRSDFIYQLPHPKIEFMDSKYAWIPDCEHYGGYTDRHAILSKTTIEPYLNILNNFILKSNEYFMEMKNKSDWNLEKVIKFHLIKNNVVVKEFPYIMYSVRNINGSTRWSSGNYSEKHGYYIKYNSEYEKSSYYKDKFEKMKVNIDDFYLISLKKFYLCVTTIKKYKAALDILLDSIPNEWKDKYILVYQNESSNDFTVFNDGHIEVYITNNISDYGNFIGINMLLNANIISENAWFLFIHDTCKFLNNCVTLTDKLLEEYKYADMDILWLCDTGQCNICLIRKNAIKIGSEMYKNIEFIPKLETIKMEWDPDYHLSPKSFNVKHHFLNIPVQHNGSRYVYNNINKRECLFFKSIDMEKYYFYVKNESDHPFSP